MGEHVTLKDMMKFGSGTAQPKPSEVQLTQRQMMSVASIRSPTEVTDREKKETVRVNDIDFEIEPSSPDKKPKKSLTNKESTKDDPHDLAEAPT
mmetsp:Transcript_6195/g.10051  ORF Transcript_6195/g.10051 Transcript_6195/m.10051 type:complete len:94 (+) Transcript_6195:318-599(+)